MDDLSPAVLEVSATDDPFHRQFARKLLVFPHRILPESMLLLETDSFFISAAFGKS